MNEKSSNSGVAHEVKDVDVAIVGAGMAGAAAAGILARAGLKIALIDRHATYPAEFRAEKISGAQVELLKRVGLFEAVTGSASPYDDIIRVRSGLVEHVYIQEYGTAYQSMVAAARGAYPSSVDFVVGFVTRIETGDQAQSVHLSDGRTISARLVIMASGLNANIVEELGIGYHTTHKGHTLCIGFTVAPVGRTHFDFTSLTLHGTSTKDKIDYITLFPMEGALRANIFTYHTLNDPWALRLRDAPRETLLASLPKLGDFLGNFEVIERPKFRAIDLRFAKDYQKPGVVLIGDAFQTSCPAAGTGLTRALTDVDRLCNVYIPRWFETAGMGAEKIAQFYGDPEKQENDERAYQLAQYHRALTVDTGVRWELRRRLVYVVRQAKALASRILENTSKPKTSIRAGT